MPATTTRIQPCAARPVALARRPFGASLTPQRNARLHRVFPRAAAVETEVDAKETVETVDIEEYCDEDGEAFTTAELQSLVTTICEETKLAQVELKMGGSTLKVHRRLHAAAAPVAAAAETAPVAANPLASATLDDSVDEDGSMDESLILIESPKVGVMRRGIYNKAGKKVGSGPAEGDKVRKGQALCSIEQLGTYVPMRAPMQGEVVSFYVEDGGPVEYHEAVVEFLPYFGGHIIGDSKYA
ncbi:hypothetical protein BSKO_11851 [Bryopsis sp. KO-2023]|nr:hypothetical protein BSKO_11851 [Bryopsis sp. KO-2023]